MRLRWALRPGRNAPKCDAGLFARTAAGRPTGQISGHCAREATDGGRCYYHRKIDEGLIT